MKYFELQPTNNRAKSSYKDPAYLEENLLGHQIKEVMDLSQLKIPTQILKGNQKLADFYFPSSDLTMRFLISDRAKVLFESFRNGNIRYYPCPIKHGTKMITNFWITDKLIYDDEWIDFDQSEFEYNDMKFLGGEDSRTRRYQDNIQEMRFKNAEELWKFKFNRPNHLSKVSIKTVKIKEECTLPILNFKTIGIFYIIISEEIKTKIESLGMDKGIEFKPFDVPDEEWGGPNGLRKQFYN